MSVRPEDYDEVVSKIRRRYEDDIRKGNQYEKPPRISTGSIELDAAMGGGVPIGRWTRFYGGYHCLAPNTQILCADFQWRPVEDLVEGDKIVGFDEYAPGGSGKQRQFQEATVLSNPVKRLPAKRILVHTGQFVTASTDHLWLITTAAEGKRGATVWKRTDDLKRGDRILWFGQPWGKLSMAVEREAAAYLGGLFDGEGSVYKGRVQFYQNEGEVLTRATAMLHGLDFETSVYDNKECKRVSVEATVAGTMRFFAQIPTARLSNGAGNWWQGHEIIPKGRFRKPDSSYATILDIEDVGVQEVFAIGTSSKTLIANGLFSHNSCKTLTSLNVIREAQSMGFLCAYYNVEKQYDPVFAKEKIGVNVDELDVVEGTSIEEIGDKMEALLSVVHVHVVDSCSIAVSEDELDADVRDWRPGIGARAWGKVFRRLNDRFDHHDNTVILLDQMRSNYQTGGEQAAGGRIFDFQASMSVHFKKGAWLFRNDAGILDAKAKQEKGSSGQIEPSGMEIKARVDKSRVGRPLLTATMHLDLETKEFDRVFELAKAATHYGVVTTTGKGRYEYDGHKMHGMPALREYIENNQDLQNQIRETVMEIVGR